MGSDDDMVVGEVLLTLRIVGRRLGMGAEGVRYLIKQGRIRAINIGNVKPSIRIKASDVDAFIESSPSYVINKKEPHR
jgi:excisionase family DNA binding protein